MLAYKMIYKKFHFAKWYKIYTKVATRIKIFEDR